MPGSTYTISRRVGAIEKASPSSNSSLEDTGFEPPLASGVLSLGRGVLAETGSLTLRYRSTGYDQTRTATPANPHRGNRENYPAARLRRLRERSNRTASKATSDGCRPFIGFQTVRESFGGT